MPAPEKKCLTCGCTEDRACVISVVIAGADGTSNVVINRGCSWSQLHPDQCTACEAAYGGNSNETEILIDLFPAEFDPQKPRAEKGASERT
jgi:hypothetical protein